MVENERNEQIVHCMVFSTFSSNFLHEFIAIVLRIVKYEIRNAGTYFDVLTANKANNNQ